MKSYLSLLTILICFQFQILAENITVSSLEELNMAIAKSNNKITLQPGNYDLKQLPDKARIITFSGSNNIIDLSDTYVNATVSLVRSSYITVTGSNNTILGGEFEDTYKNGLKQISDFSAYNKDRDNLARGLRGDPVMHIKGDNNTVNGIKLTVRGSYPYGYGSFYGIGRDHVYGLDKRCGILINGVSNTLDNVEIQQRAFGHGIYMQGDADKTVIKNSLVEGRMRRTAELYDETDPKSLPKRSDYKMPNDNNRPFPKDKVHSLCEDGIRMYKIPGSITVENCTVKKMRGGIRLYLGGPATVKNCTVQHCEYTCYNLPSEGEVIKSSGDFTFSPLSDYRLRRNRTKAEWTILPSPDATGSHNIMDLQGNDHQIILNRGKGPLVQKKRRAIVITGNGSTITNNTEYPIILAEGSKDNEIHSYGPVSGNLDNNSVTKIKSLKFVK